MSKKVGTHGEEGCAKRMEQIQKQTEEFLQNNPSIAKALELFRIGNDEYLKAYSSQRQPRMYTSTSSNPGRGVADGRNME